MTKSICLFPKYAKLAAMFAVVYFCAYPAFAQIAQNKEPKVNPFPQNQEPFLEASDSEAPQIVRVFEISRGDCNAIGSALASIGLKRMYVDERNYRIIVMGTDIQLKEVAKIIQVLDVRVQQSEIKPTAVNVRIIWLADGDETASAPDGNLKEVVDELHALGLKNIGQVGQALVRSQNGGQFQISCTPRTGNNLVRLHASGTISKNQDLRIGLRATAVKEKSENAEKLVELNAETVYKPGEYIVLSVAPIGEITSIFVIQITENNRPQVPQMR